MVRTPLIAAALAGSAMLVSLAPAAAQNAAPDASKIAEIIVYGSDPCPRSTDDEVVVCARKPESERYRIPERLRSGGSIQSRQAWAQRAKNFEVATRSGIGSCDAVGPGGQAGCLQRLIDQARAERSESVAGDTPPKE